MTPTESPEPALGAPTPLERAQALQTSGELDAAESLCLEILAESPRSLEALELLGSIKGNQGNLGAALEVFQRAVMLSPRSPQAQLFLGITQWELGLREEALTHLQFALRLDPTNPEACFQVGHALQELGRFEEALVQWDRLLALNPSLSPKHDYRGLALLNRASALNHLHRFKEALSAFNLASILQPDSIEALLGRAALLHGLRRAEEALASADRALSLDASAPLAHMHRGNALMALKRQDEAMVSYQRALELKPIWPGLIVNLSTAMHQLNRHQEAMDYCNQALALDPTMAMAHSSKIGLLDYLPGNDMAELQRERRRFYETHARRLEAEIRPHGNDRSPNRRLILGYVSADFMHHATASCFLPVLQNHNPSEFQINCYSGVVAEDEWTQRCRDCSDLWRRCANLSDEALAALIREDQVDILIDLSGHTAGNRLMVFARKPAPVQVSGWGHGEGTGLPTMDYLFADPLAIPEWQRSLFAETIWDLPAHIPFQAPPHSPPIAALPARSNGFITFGSLNRYTKVTPEVEKLWAQVLLEVPGSRLFLKDALFDDPLQRATVQQAFSNLGVDPERLEFRGSTPRTDHLGAYGCVDIALDPFPMNGGITTWEALWMGAPVIAKLGTTLANRGAAALLHALDLDPWFAEDEAGYVAVAARMAADLDALAKFREEIRNRILDSEAGNPERYTRAVEAAYRSMWQRWLKQSDPSGTLP